MVIQLPELLNLVKALMQTDVPCHDGVAALYKNIVSRISL